LYKLMFALCSVHVVLINIRVNAYK
jgi:hypothetical protein